MEKSLQPGMALGVQRLGYKHYGVYAGLVDRTHFVVHYNDKFNGGKGRIEPVSLADFKKDDRCWIENFRGAVEYTDGVCQKSFERVATRLGEQKYCVVTNNCEHLAAWCVTGKSQSPQVTEIVAGLILNPKETAQTKIAECVLTMLDKAFTKHPVATTLGVLGTIVLVGAAAQRGSKDSRAGKVS